MNKTNSLFQFVQQYCVRGFQEEYDRHFQSFMEMYLQYLKQSAQDAPFFWRQESPDWRAKTSTLSICK